MKEKSTSDETMRIKKILESREQSFYKKKHLENLLQAYENLYMAIQQRIKKATITTKHMVLGFIPVFSKKQLDQVDQAKLALKLIKIEDAVWNTKKYYESWTNRCKVIEKTDTNNTNECNKNFDETLKIAKEIKDNIILQQIISNYEMSNTDQLVKNEFYLLLKQHINNRKVYGKQKR